MTHEQIDALGPVLQQQCNDEIARRHPTWSRYAVDQMIDATMDELAPHWSWLTLSTINGAPQIILTQYIGYVGAE